MERNTIQRSIVYETVIGMHDHPSADMVYEKLRKSHPAIGRSTVFRTLRALADEGRVRRVNLSVAADRYDFTLAPHAHIVCRICGRVDDLPDVAEPEEPPCEAGGYQIETREIIYRGVCPACTEVSKQL